MRISILCSNKEHPVYPHLRNWMDKLARAHDIELVEKSSSLSGGDLLFLISCNELIGKTVRSKYRASLVIHASDVPKGRGWSPLIWQILEGKNTICVTLLEASDRVDSGNIWKQLTVELEGHELYDEINNKLFDVELQLMDFAVKHAGDIYPLPQQDKEATFYKKRTPEDSRLDPYKTIAEQFDLLRIADPDRYPAFIDFRGHRYRIRLFKEDKNRVSLP